MSRSSRNDPYLGRSSSISSLSSPSHYLSTSSPSSSSSSSSTTTGHRTIASSSSLTNNASSGGGGGPSSLSSSSSPRLSIKSPTAILHSPPSKLERSIEILFGPFNHRRSISRTGNKKLRRLTILFFSSIIGLILYTIQKNKQEDSSNYSSSSLKGNKRNRRLRELEKKCTKKNDRGTIGTILWKKECLGIHSKFDELHFENLHGHLIYPAHENRGLKSTMTTTTTDIDKEEEGLIKPPQRIPSAVITSTNSSTIPAQPHPIHMLIDSAQRNWDKKLARQSKTLREAIEEYERRYQRRPPKGFSDWWWYAKGNDFLLVDEFDALNENILPFLAIPSSVLQQRAEKIQHDQQFWIQDKTFTLELKGSGRIVKAHGPMKDHPLRPDQMIKLITPLSKYLPDMNITFTGHDNPWIVLSGEAKEHLIQKGKAGEYADETHLNDPKDDWSFDGWAVSCPPNAPLRQVKSFDDRIKRIDSSSSLNKPPSERSLIQDHVAAMDVCNHPERQLLHGFTLWPGPRPGLLYPLFSLTKSSMHSDLLIPPIDQFDFPTGNDPVWEDKKKDKVVWRGTTTGADLNQAIMRDHSQRPRLCRLPLREGKITLTYAPNDKPNRLGPTEQFTANAQDLANGWFDFQFLGKPQQCNDPIACAEFAKEFKWSEFMTPDQQNEYKYMIDVDGNGWSGRFHRLLSTNSLVFKSTIFPEWYRDHIQPWLHYVPISTDYHDLWEIMAFFKGDQNSRGEHDALAKGIAEAGKQFVKTCWRMEDMRIYTYRLLLEYARIMNRDDDDPTSMDM